MKPTTFILNRLGRDSAIQWLHTSFGKPDILKWKYYDDCSWTKVKIMNTDDSLIFVLSCSDFIV